MQENFHSKVRFVVPRYGEEVVGGIESLVKNMAENLAKNGWEVVVITSTATSEHTWNPYFDSGLSIINDVQVRRFDVLHSRNPKLFSSFSRIFFHLPKDFRPEQLWYRFQGPYIPEILEVLSKDPNIPTIFAPYLYFPTVYGIRLPNIHKI